MSGGRSSFRLDVVAEARGQTARHRARTTARRSNRSILQPRNSLYGTFPSAAVHAIVSRIRWSVPCPPFRAAVHAIRFTDCFPAQLSTRSLARIRWSSPCSPFRAAVHAIRFTDSFPAQLSRRSLACIGSSCPDRLFRAAARATRCTVLFPAPRSTRSLTRFRRSRPSIRHLFAQRRPVTGRERLRGDRLATAL
jgi:hypothetical protein